MAALTSEDFGEHLRPETRAAHAEEKSMREALPRNVVGQSQKGIDARALSSRDVQRAEPLCLVGVGPQAGVARPEAAHVPITAPSFERHCHGLFHLGGKHHGLAVEPVSENGPPLAGKRSEQLVERFGEELNALLDELFRYRVYGDITASQRRHRQLGL